MKKILCIICRSTNIYHSKACPNFLNTTPKRTFEDYTKIKKEMGFKHLTEEDMEWIDENVKEEKDTITNKGTEPSSPCKPTGELNNSVATNTHPNAS